MTEQTRVPAALDKRQWLELAELAIRRWNLSPAELNFLACNGKAVLKVQAPGGDYVLRLYPPGGLNAAALQSELCWLTTIRRQTELLAPSPVSALVDGRMRNYLDIHSDQLPALHQARAALFEFINGESKTASELATDDVHRIGEYLGALHRDGQNDRPAKDAATRLDWNGLFGDDESPYSSGREREWLSASQRAIYADVARHSRERMSRMASMTDNMGMIHADLLAKNILFVDESIAALDFEYCAWGYFLYDLAPLLWQLKGDRAGDYPELEESLWRGYTSIRPQADNDRDLLESMTAARQIASCRWLLANMSNPAIGELAPALIDQRFTELRGFLDSGILRRSSPTL